MYGWILGALFFILGVWVVRENYKPTYGWGEKEIKTGNLMATMAFGMAFLCLFLSLFGL
jgi:hypothetical protein